MQGFLARPVSYKIKEIKLFGGEYQDAHSTKNLISFCLVRRKTDSCSDEKKKSLLLSEVPPQKSSTEYLQFLLLSETPPQKSSDEIQKLSLLSVALQTACIPAPQTTYTPKYSTNTFIPSGFTQHQSLPLQISSYTSSRSKYLTSSTSLSCSTSPSGSTGFS